MDQLPIEIIENILNDPNISIEDVVNFSSACSYFRNIVTNSQAVWKQKFRQKWPHLVGIFHVPPTFYEEVQFIYEFKKTSLKLLETMPGRFYKKYELSDTDLEEWGDLVREPKQSIHYLVDYLRQIVNTNADILSIMVVPLNTPGNKTLQYYANKVLRFVLQLHLAKVWDHFAKLPPKQQLLEKGAVFVAQWCLPQTEVTYKSISDKLDSIAQLVKYRLYQSNPEHELFKTSPEKFQKWKEETLDENQWTIPECRELMAAMKDVIYTTLGFSGNNLAYYAPQNSFINEVLERKMGLPITMAIIYESVGRRLGLLLEPISFPAHFLLRFTENKSEWYYIDIFNGGNVIRRGACPHSGFAFKKEIFPVASAVQVVERMANNLELSARQHTQANGRVTRLRSILELLKLVSPQDLTALVSLAKFYMLHNMNTKSLENYLLSQKFESPEQAQRIVKMLRDYTVHRLLNEDDITNKVEVAQRTDNLNYAVGMVMLHSTFNYKCVIYDWDPVCLASVEWQIEMNVNKLRFRNQQPFYNVIVEDGSYRYVAQENLKPTSEIGVLHLNEDLGRHFSHFFMNHYVPNAEKDREYPEDHCVRHKFYYDLQNCGRFMVY